jgi:hypothetical protein
MESSSYGEDRREIGGLAAPVGCWVSLLRNGGGKMPEKRFQLRGDIGRSHTPNACVQARLLPAEPYSLVDERTRNGVVAPSVGGTTLFAVPKWLD